MKKTTYFYYVITEQNNETRKLYSHAEKIPACYNLLDAFKPFTGFTILHINAVETWKEAQKTADLWNESAKNKNSYAF